MTPPVTTRTRLERIRKESEAILRDDPRDEVLELVVQIEELAKLASEIGEGEDENADPA